MAVAAALVYPNISALYSAGEAVSFLGIPVTLISYPCSVIPIVVAVFIQAKFEKLIKPLIPQVVRGIFVPLLSLVVTALLTFLVIGPVTNIVAVGLADGIGWLLDVCPPVAGFVFGAIYPVMLIFGLHWGLVPLVMNNLATTGVDPIMAMTLATNFALAGCAFGVFLKSKNQEIKQTALISTCVLTVPAFVAMMGVIAAIVAAIGFFGGIILTYLFGYNDKMLDS